jgi:hypothetical protein
VHDVVSPHPTPAHLFPIADDVIKQHCRSSVWCSAFIILPPPAFFQLQMGKGGDKRLVRLWPMQGGTPHNNENRKRAALTHLLHQSTPSLFLSPLLLPFFSCSAFMYDMRFFILCVHIPPTLLSRLYEKKKQLIYSLLLSSRTNQEDTLRPCFP